MDFDRLAQLGITRAPGEDGEAYVQRCVYALATERHAYGTAAWYEGLARAESRWITQVTIKSSPGEVELRPRGPFGIRLPRRVRRRLETKLNTEKPVNVRLEVC